MQNRFTVKDFFYMLIGVVICVLIGFNIRATNREATNIESVNSNLTSQHATLSSLNSTLEEQRSAIVTLRESIAGLNPGEGLDAEAIRQLTETMRQGSGGTGIASESGSATSENTQNTARFQAGYNPKNVNPIHTSEQNMEGLPQQWQTAPDRELPEDFASGDTLIQVWQTDAQKLTPLVSTDSYSRRVFWYTLEYLVNIDLDAPFPHVPGLAKAWEVSDDGMELTFHINERARWWDGRPVTAEDVIFTWDSAVNERLDTAHLRSYIRDNVESWEAPGPHTVRFRMKQPYFDAVGICGNLLFIIPKHVYGDFDPETWNNDIPDLLRGSGPYVLESHRKNDEIVLVRNENYWGPKPPLERIVTRIIPNELPGLQQFRAENVDLITPTGEQWVENANARWLVDRDVTTNQYYSPRGGYAYIGYNLRRPHFADRRTRQALTMLIDREGLIDNVLNGQGRITTGPFFFKSDQFNDEIEPWPYDPERAISLLAEVGWEDTNNDGVIDKDLDGDGIRDPFEVTYLLPSGGSAGEKLQRFVQEGFRQAGIKLNLDQLEWTVFLDRLDSREYDMVTLSWTGNPETDPHQIWHSDSEPNKGSNHVGFINEEADRLIETARRELDDEKRMSLWHEFHALLHEEQPYTFLYSRPSRYFAHERLRNVEPRDYRPYFAEWYVPVQDQLR